MIRFILIAAVCAGIGICILKLIKTPKGNWKQPLKLLLPLLALVLGLFVLTGKAHLLGILLAGLIPFLKNIAPFILSYGPKILDNRKKSQTGENGFNDHSESVHSQPDQEYTPSKDGKMTRNEAVKILGLSDNPTTEEIKNAHRRLMQKVHPDHGGNDYLASQLNEAKKILLS